MFLALHEIRRGLVRFGLLTMALGLLLFLVLFQQALQDGLLTSFVGAVRNQSAPVIVYALDGQRTLQGSVLTTDLESAILAVEGIGDHGRIGQGTFTTTVNGREATDTAVIGTDTELGQPTELADGRRAAAAGEAIGSTADFTVGDTVAVSARGEPLTLTVVGVADDVQLSVTPTLFATFDDYVEAVRSVNPDTQFSGQATLWASIDTWREVTAANRPADAFGDQSVQALVVRTDGEADEVATAIDQATDGATTTLTKSAAIEAIPGVAQQRSTFNQIIGVTALIAVVVVALFFALITVERVGLYGVLKAIGASSPTLFGGVVAQAAGLATVATLLGVGGALALDTVIPPGSIPFEVTSGRLVASGVLMLAAAIIGSAFSLRRVLRIDSAAAIGAMS